MKAARMNQWKAPLTIEELPEPTPGDDQVLVRVRAASVNPIDRVIASGMLASMYSVPMTPGTDFAGEVVAVGSNVTHVRPGDAVFGMSLARGTFAEFAAVSAEGVAHRPRAVDDLHAAAVPLSGLTAWQTLFYPDLGNLKRGQTVLILGAGGGVGSLAVQMAKNAGAHVIALDRGNRRDFVKAVGADEFIDSDVQRFENVVRNVDLVLDLIGGEFIERSFPVIKAGGRLITTPAEVPEGAGEGYDVYATNTFTQPTVEDLTTLAQEIDAGRLKPFVNHTFPLAEAEAALHFKSQDSPPGNVVIVIA